MEKLWKRILSFVLVISLIITSSVNAFALADEEYLCELRIVYADTYNEAKEILADSEFKDYKLFKENLGTTVIKYITNMDARLPVRWQRLF